MILVRNEVLNLMGIIMVSVWFCEYYSFIRFCEVILFVLKVVCFLDKEKKSNRLWDVLY